ncbi:MAG: nitrilase-related carbon-nitrogen hydrolase, partial [Planctomycetota bacterium]|nr:nitrilase-related carbon-nitrogen hydrolase [Planctomycetota bacterium]
MNIAMAQLNPMVGDIAGNVRRILDAYRRAAEQGADLVLTPELSILGYPPKDLLLKPRFVADGLAAVERLVREVDRPALLVGYAGRRERKRGRPLHNTVALIAD